MFRFISLTLLSLVTSVFTLPASNYYSLPYFHEFLEFTDTYNKSYNSVNETVHRYNIFVDNVNNINRHNNEMKEKGHTFKMGVNQFTDLTNKEFRGNLRKRNVINHDATIVVCESPNIPDNFNWVKHQPRVVTPVKNQAQCGSCWAFSTTGSVESAHAIKTGKLISLSEQQLVDCSFPEGNEGCMGGFMYQAFQYIIDKKGICSEKSYPYQGVDELCQQNCTRVVKIKGYHNVTASDENQMKVHLFNLPLSVAMQANLPSFQSYKKGIYHDPQCIGELDHGVLLVGYGHNKKLKKDYWIVKNSWGVSWGKNGYFLLARNINQIGNVSYPNGMCGIASSPSFPVV